MTKRMLIDATHAEETRVVVLDGSRLEDFDIEAASRKQLKGNIYLAKVVRVEPSLQAAFVEYGGNRHGFLAFGEIHPDYYQIPVADRQRLIEMQLEDARHEAEEEDRAAAAAAGHDDAGHDDDDAADAASENAVSSVEEIQTFDDAGGGEITDIGGDVGENAAVAPQAEDAAPIAEATGETMAEARGERAQPLDIVAEAIVSAPADEAPIPSDAAPLFDAETTAEAAAEFTAEATARAMDDDGDDAFSADGADEPPPPAPESLGGDTVEEPRERRNPPRFMRSYKIQEVIKRRQILLIQVVKEERGTKGAALTTYISLAGRYSVLMPNSPRGGGISRKITSATDRRRLKEVTTELALPKGMGLIVRTAGANRPKPEIKRDCEYLLRLWDDIREHTMRSVAPALIYEEASLIKRTIRDVYSRDVDEILVDGEDGWKAAHDFMRMLMPSHANKVQMWREHQPLFARQGVEAQLDNMLNPTVQLRSGGYLVINQAEALVAIDVNSGRSTRERNIEETALRTNLEAADEAARQLRLRDLAGLIVIDFIDMESRKHNAMVERRLKEALKNDRARIQVGQISHFGLLEMSRQRLRPSLAETSLVMCPHCNGTGHVRSVETAALHVLRQVEEEGAKRRSAEIVVHVAGAVAMYILNHKRVRLAEIESRYGLQITFAADEKLIAPEIRIDRVRAAVPSELPPAIQVDQAPVPLPASVQVIEDDDDAADDDAGPNADAAEDDDEEKPVAGETAEEDERRRRRRRRRRGGRRDEAGAAASVPIAEGAPGEASELAEIAEHIEGVPEFAEPAPVAAGEGEAAEDNADGANRRRGRRGGRRRRREDDPAALAAVSEPGAEQPELPAYAGPTPADPFGGQSYDIFAVMEQAEQAAEQAAAAPAVPPAPALAEVEALAVASAEAVVVTSAPMPAPMPAPEPVAAAGIAMPGPVAAVPELVPQPVLELAFEPEKIPEPAMAEAEPAREEPAIKPIVIGVDEAPEAPKKRGWWRR